MDFVFNSMPKFDRRAMTLSEWLVKLEHRFALAEVNDNAKKINLCALFIGQTGEDILLELEADTTWEAAKAALSARIGEGTDAEEAWTALKNVTRGGRELIDLGSHIEKLARRAYPGQQETAQRHAIEAFIISLEGSLAREVLKLGHTTLADVITAARRIEKLEKEYPSPTLASFTNLIRDGFSQLKKEMEETRTTKEPTVKLAQNTPPAKEIVTYASASTSNPEFMSAPAMNPYQGRQIGNRNPGRYPPPPGRHRRCFLCDEEGHFVANCPLKQEIRRFRQSLQPGPLALPAASPQNPAPGGPTSRSPQLN